MKVTITMKDGSVRVIEENIGRIAYSKDASGMLSLFEPGKDLALLNTDFSGFEVVEGSGASHVPVKSFGKGKDKAE